MTLPGKGLLALAIVALTLGGLGALWSCGSADQTAAVEGGFPEGAQGASLSADASALDDVANIDGAATDSASPGDASGVDSADGALRDADACVRSDVFDRQLPPPTFSPRSGTAAPGTVTINEGAGTPAGTIILYTTDGTLPTRGSAVYSGPIPVTTNTTIHAFAVSACFPDSPIATASYDFVGPGPGYDASVTQ